MKKRTTISLVLLFCLAAFCTYNLVKPDPDISTKPVIAKVEMKNTQMQEQKINNDFQKGMKQLLRENDSLQFLVKTTKELLLQSRQKVFALQDKVTGLAQKEKIETDTIEKIVLCDSLQNEVESLIEQSNARDSLCDNTVTNLTEILGSKDTAIAICNQSYLGMKTLLDNSLAQEKDLTYELNSMNKKLKRKTVGNRILSAGLLVLTGITTTLFLQRKP